MKISRPPTHMIYDLDGVLLDTEPLYTQVTREIVEAYGKEFDWSVKRDMIGRPSLEAAEHLVDALELPFSALDYLDRRSSRLEELFASAVAVKGAERFTREVGGCGVGQAVATSSERRLFDIKSSGHRSWFSLFSAVVTGDDPRLAEGKPAPDIFLLAAADLGAQPSGCLVVEDSPAGVEAALRAGMQVIALPDAAMEPGVFAGADLVIGGFDEIVPADLGLAPTS